jgi:ABC-type lipoprotein export system ATPase subunit
MIEDGLLTKPFRELLLQYPFLSDFFSAQGLPLPAAACSLAVYFDHLSENHVADLGLGREELKIRFLGFFRQMETFRSEGKESVRQVTILGGHDKNGCEEKVRLELRPGDVVSVVGPTGSGKSRLLADIECLAQGDTPSGRRILINQAPPQASARLSGEGQLVAQLSQNMNFVMDLSVREFLQMHAESRLVADRTEVIGRIYDTAVALAGEPFTLDTPVTALSGGQSRALMIADVACLSASPIVLIDEIENAGVDRRRALELLVQQEKIILLATHDPLLALLAERRLVIKNGAIVAVLETSAQEQTDLVRLDAFDRQLALLREQLRCGGRIRLDKAIFGGH